MHDSGRTEHNIIGLCFIQHETDNHLTARGDFHR